LLFSWKGSPVQQDKLTRSLHSVERAAYHEAGHAVLAHFLGVALRQVSIVTDQDSPGHVPERGEYSEDTEYLRTFAEEAFWLRMAIARYAGVEAERRLTPRSRNASAEEDYKRAAVALEKITMDWPSRRALYFYARWRARLLVENYWPEIEAVARALMDRRQLDAEELGKMIRRSVLARRGMLMSY
jgi:hypothetical protein